MNYKQQLNIIEGLFIPPETLIRVDCPFCKNINTLSVDTTENNIKWYCFHASCKAKGKKEGEKNMQYVSATFNKKENNISQKFIIPDSFKIVSTNKNAQMYLHKNNCWEAWAWGRADIKYDVKHHWVVKLSRVDKGLEKWKYGLLKLMEQLILFKNY